MRSRWLQIGVAMAVALAAIGGGLALWRAGLWDLWTVRGRLENWLLQVGPWGPLLIVGLQVLQTVVAPLPGQIVGLAAGYVYGALWGTVLCAVGSVIGSALAVWLARRLGRGLVERWVRPQLLARWDALVEQRGSWALFLIFLFPFLPDDLICLAAGLSRLPIWWVAVLALLGRTPGIAVSALIGAQSRQLSLGQMALIGLVGLALSVLVLRYHRRLEALMFRLVERLSNGE
jgi:uncharacterized membrane protein YdjX (TVP38/TMEM64 family)